MCVCCGTVTVCFCGTVDFLACVFVVGLLICQGCAFSVTLCVSVGL